MNADTTTLQSALEHGYALAIPPNGDFLFAQWETTPPRAALEMLKKQMGQIGLLESVLDVRSVAYGPIAIEQNSVVVSGIVVPDSGPALRGPSSFALSTMPDISEATGQFSAFCLTEGMIEARQDYFGMGSLYTYVWHGGALVTNRAHLAAIFIGAAELSIDIDKEEVLTLVLEHPFFAAQAFTDRTYIRGLERVAVSGSAIIRAGNLTSPEGESLRLVRPSREEYEGLLRMAKLEVERNYSALYSLFPDKVVVADLSGGLDSRLAIAPGLSEDGLRPLIRTHDVAGSDDLYISAKIAAEFDLSYASSPAGRHSRLTARQSLTLWRSFMMGEYNNMGLAPSAIHGEGLAPAATDGAYDHVRITGAAGEISRGFWSKALEGYLSENSIDSVSALCSTLLDGRSPLLSKVSEADALALRGHVERQALVFDRAPFDTALLDHYLAYRNRSHFGLRNFSSAVDTFYQMPLLSKSLYAASRSLTTQECVDGKPFRDLIRLFDERLAAIAFDGEGGMFDDDVAVAGKLEEWNASNASIAAAYCERGAGLVGVQGELTAPSPKRVVSWAVAWAVRNVGELFPDLLELLELVAGNYRQKARLWPRDASYTASRILATEDFLSVGTAMSPLVTTDDVGVLRHLDPIASMEVSQREGGVCVTVTLHPDVPEGSYEYAFDCRRYGVKVESTWYQARSTWVMQLEGSSGDVITSYVRLKADGRVFLISANL